MTIRVALEHRTSYRFDQPVRVWPHTVRLRPAPHSRTPIEAYSLTVSPSEHFINWQQDPFGNFLARIVFPQPVTELEFRVDLVADMTVINPFDFFVEDYAERFPFAYTDQLEAELAPYLRTVDSERVAAWIREHIDLPEAGMPIVDFLVLVNRLVRDDVDYSIRMEPGVQTPDLTLERAIGSCRDSAWLLVTILRRLGLAARFVSGYLVQLRSDVESLDGPSGPAEDFTDLHAWAEVFVPGAGWIGMDATSGLFAGEGHIPLSATPDPSSSAPISGATSPANVAFDFANVVRRIHEDPRVTKPYSPTQWHEVNALGAAVDSLLEAADVRLTMGGEPTFVSLDDATTPQWNGEADGEEKRVLAASLAERMRDRLDPHSLVHHGQGKWYPGEPLPRWQIQLSRRLDGRPLWRTPELLAHPWSAPSVEPHSGASRAAVAHTAAAIARRMGVPEPFIVPAYEDALAAAHAEAMQPAGPQPDIDLAPDASADTFVREHDANATAPQAQVVPLFRSEAGDAWATARWQPRRQHLYLVPGDSPAGMRLPLASIAWADAPRDFERVSGAPGTPRAGARGPAVETPIEDAKRTAVVVEERDGLLYVFLPPLEELADALDLLDAVQEAVEEVGVPCVIEGYPLPGDPSVETMSITPDPGVIEVNLAPVTNWPDYVAAIEGLYEDARQSRLTTEKFDLDGSHTGTGGGNHITLGGATPEDSPLLRRPDLLRSIVTYWQHHPALSYVFSGRFIGPTSQAPRFDEGLSQSLYEMEIAFDELDRSAREHPEGAPLWHVDRLFRNLLTDLTGNTHRAELCIDKLYAPGSQRGRLGLLELRGFEMPPHPQMAMVQALLVRLIVARSWLEPYRHDLVRWGSGLHDRFLVPEYAAADLRDVVNDLNAFLDRQAPDAPHLQLSWFDPFFEFRFPRIGEQALPDGITLELRQGVEPWNVLGEESSSQGTSRYVDSSVERIQVRALGLTPGRHEVTCNGVPLPLRETSPGVFVAGVRFRAWDPWSSLHPTMGVHSPLTFDVVDRWNELSIGGVTYHVAHPGGRNYERPPVNAVEAESRRESRFERMGLTGGVIDTSWWPKPGELRRSDGKETPITLDLRRFGPGQRTRDDDGMLRTSIPDADERPAEPPAHGTDAGHA